MYISILVMKPTTACNSITLLFAQSGCKPCQRHPLRELALRGKELTQVKLLAWPSQGSALGISTPDHVAPQP